MIIHTNHVKSPEDLIHGTHESELWFFYQPPVSSAFTHLVFISICIIYFPIKIWEDLMNFKSARFLHPHYPWWSQLLVP